jgi:hypothetical protein
MSTKQIADPRPFSEPYDLATWAKDCTNYLGEHLREIHEELDYLHLVKGVVDRTNVIDYGADPTGVSDSTEAIQDAIAAAVVNKSSIYLPHGTYKLSTSGTTIWTITDDVAIIGDDATIQITDGIYRITADEVINPTLSANINRGDTQITVSSTAGVSVGDLYHIQSDQIAESGWSTVKHDTHIVAEVVDATHLRLATRSNFGYDTAVDATTIRIYHRRALHLEGVTIDMAAGAAIQLYALHGVEIERVRTREPAGTRAVTPLTLIRCVGVRGRAVTIEGAYCIEAAACRDVRFDGCIGYMSKHFLAPNYWTDGVTVSHLYGHWCDGVVDSHPAFDVAYEDVLAFDKECSSPRAIGMRLSRVKIISAQTGAATCYIAGISLVAGLLSINDDYDCVFEDVEWRFPDALPTDILMQFQFGRAAYMRNVRFDQRVSFASTQAQGGFHEIHGDCVSWLRMACRDQDVYMRNLHETSDGTGYGLYRLDGAVNIFEGCNFENMASVVDAAIDPNTHIRFVGCKFKTIGTFGTAFGSANPYRFMFIGCVFDAVLAWEDVADRVLTAYLRAEGNTYLNGTPELLAGTATWDPASIADGDQTTTTVTVTGARLGDRVAVSSSISTGGLILTGFVSASDTVTAVLANLTGAPVDLGSSTITAQILRT